MPDYRSGQRPDDLGQVLVDLITLRPTELAQRLAALSPQRLALVLEQAAAHSVAPLLRYRLIEQGLFEPLPAPAKDVLDATYFTSSAQAMARYRELGMILERLATAGIPVIALKGIYLAKADYPEPGLRPMADIDLLFRVADLRAVETILFELGYGRADADRPIADYVFTRHQLPPFVRADATSIEVHMLIERPQSPFAIDHRGIWERARPWPLNGRPLLAMASEDLLLHLCLHAMYHHDGRIPLIALIDITRVVDGEVVDWDRVVERTLEWKSAAPVFLGLELSRRLCAANIPAGPIEVLRPEKSAESSLEFFRQTLLHPRSVDRRNDDLKKRRGSLTGYLGKLSSLRALPTWRARLGFLLSLVFPERSVLERQYPKFKGSGWVRVMYGVHWLVASGRFLRAAALNWRYWLTRRNLDRRWFS